MPTILGANSDTAAYEITNSLRFNPGDSPKLSFNQGTPTSRKTWTYSTWAKRGNFGNVQASMLSWGDEDFFDVRFQDGTPDDGIMVFISDGDSKNIATTRLFRDPSAWYHIVIASDTTDGTAGDRTRIYVNGVEETVFTNEAQPDQNYEYRGLVSGDPIVIGNRYTGSHYFDGYLADTHFIDGQQLTPSNFGKTNDNGVWIPKKYLGTFGTNGFKLEYKQTGTSQNSSGIGADTSGNDNHMTVTNLAATDVTTDTPTNNFATLNPLDNAVLTLSEGNTKATHSSSSGGEENRATLGSANGKWYFEFQVQHTVGSLNPFALGMMSNTGQTPLESDLKSTEAFTSAWHTDSSSNRIETRVAGSNTNLNCNLSYPDNGDIVQVAMDIDNGKVYFGKNGTYINDASGNAGNPGGNANPVATFTTGGHFYFPAIHNRGSQGLTVSLNTGQPSFSISSSNADANGHGNFEYAVPSGYFALCTKNLAEHG